MDIAAISKVLNQGKVQQQAGISVMKITMDTANKKGNMVMEFAETGTSRR